MAGLVPAIYVDARHKAGHDEEGDRFDEDDGVNETPTRLPAAPA
jgi:hypothetical protein